jgi:hypothetical protein
MLYSCLIVGHFQAFQIVDKEPFRRLLKYLRPNMPDKDISHRTKIKDSIMDRADMVVDIIKKWLVVRYLFHIEVMHSGA